MIEVGKSSGNQFKAEFFSGALTHSLSSATPLTITPPAGKTLRLDYLSAVSVFLASVTVGPTVIVTNKILSGSHTNSDGYFIVSNSASSSTNTATASNTVQPIIAFEPDQSIVITQGSSGANTIHYSYSYGG